MDESVRFELIRIIRRIWELIQDGYETEDMYRLEPQKLMSKESMIGDWLKAMNALASFGVIRLKVCSSKDGSLVLTRISKETFLTADVDNIRIVGFKQSGFHEFCKEHNIDLLDPDLGEHIRAEFSLSLGYSPIVEILGQSYELQPLRGGMMTNVLMIAAHDKIIGREITRAKIKELAPKVLAEDLGLGNRRINELFRGSVFSGTLRGFISVTPNTIRVHEVRSISYHQFNQIKQSSDDYISKRKT